MSHANRIAVVTGAASGIGQAIALGLARRGARVVGIDLQECGQTQEEIEAAGGEWMALQADVSSKDEVVHAAKTVLSRFGRCDILINNAGIYPARDFLSLDYEEWRRVLSINLDSQFLMSKAFVPAMIEKEWGRIVNITSGSVQIAAENLSAYKASKMGTIGLTRGMAADLGRFGITVNAASPSLTRTPGVMSYGAAEHLDAMAQVQAIKRVSVATDIVGLIAFLTSDDAHFVTGQTILADGGMTFF